MRVREEVHRPVMARQVVDALAAGDARLLLDATVGAGGHAAAFLAARGLAAGVVGLDRDGEMLARARARLAEFGDRARLVHAAFADLDRALDGLGVADVDAALFDLGAASPHFDEGARGFSFLSPGPLDMRYDRTAGRTAADIVNGSSEEDLAGLLAGLGEERNARRIARAIVAERPVRDTLRLAEIVERAVGGRGRVHPATRTFQALRMAVNDEIAQITAGVPAAFRRLRRGGRLAVISFHSGEDGLVKRLLKAERGAAPLPGSPFSPEGDEVRGNPRARSARLRVYVKSEEGA